MTEIIEGLYLGDEFSASPEILLEQGVTHILTVCHRPLSREIHKRFEYLHITAHDIEDADLLSHFQECFHFIDKGRQSGGVLVHCVAGVSRSATVVIGYIMSTSELTLLKDALEMVTSKRPIIKPNPGFMNQLRLFESMGSQINNRHPHFVNYKIQSLALKVQRGARVEEVMDSYQDDPLNQTECEESHQTSFYKCRKCRRALFRITGVLSHGTGAGDVAFGWRAHHPSRASLTEDLISQESTCQRSLFIEPVDWMKNDILALEGKINCPKCSAKLGSYNWFGERCPCGTWITPAFHIQTTKVDKCKPRNSTKTTAVTDGIQ